MTEKNNKKSNERLKIAIVTGASSGLGKRFALYAHMFFPDIDEVWLVGRNEQRLLHTSKFVTSNRPIYPHPALFMRSLISGSASFNESVSPLNSSSSVRSKANILVFDLTNLDV